MMKLKNNQCSIIMKWIIVLVYVRLYQYNDAFLIRTKFQKAIRIPSILTSNDKVNSSVITHKSPKLYHLPYLLPLSKNDYNENNGDDEAEDDDDDDDYINIDHLQTSNFNPSSFKNAASISSFGPGRGRSSPSQRKAMGKSINGDATVHVCTHCGAEYVNWVGKCSTCKEWNTVQEFRVGRKAVGGSNSAPNSNGGIKMRPVFKSQYNTDDDQFSDSQTRPSSWLTGVNDGFTQFYNEPVGITDIYKQMGYDGRDADEDEMHDLMSFREKRIQIPGDEELNNVLGGGIMPGSLILLGGDPGVGKSTLLLQIAGQTASLASPPRGIGMGMDDESISHYGPVLYVSGEENSIQIASRAMRLGIDESELLLFCETDADVIAETVASYSNSNSLLPKDDFDDNHQDTFTNRKKNKMSQILKRRRKPSLLIIDSIQTMLCESGGSSSAGGITQVRECVGLFLRLAKSTGIPVILVGHVTKSGGVAGPRTVEHMVDTVLYLENSSSASGGEGSNLRMLRASKNRFGSSDEVGVYEMSGSKALGGRLLPVSDPSSLFLANRLDSKDLEGCAISIILEGMRAMSVEVQALVTPSGPSKSFSGRRTVDGLSTARLLLILAVLQKRCSISFSYNDVYTNVVGGIRLINSKKEGSSSDLAVAVALVSSLYNIPVRSDTAFVGEVGLLGELRQVTSVEKRVNEARRMGFSRIIIPKQNNRMSKKRFKRSSKHYDSINVTGIDCIEAEDLKSAIELGLIANIPKKKTKKKRDTRSKSFDDDTMNNGELPLIDDDDEDDIEFDFL